MSSAAARNTRQKVTRRSTCNIRDRGTLNFRISGKRRIHVVERHIGINAPIRTGVPRGTLARSGRWYQAARIANNLCVLILGGAGIHVGAPLSIRVTCANRFVDRRTIVRTDAVAHNASEDRSRGARIGIRDEHTFAASRANRLIREGAVGGAIGRLPLCACRMVLQAKNTSGGACGDEDKSFPVFHFIAGACFE
jgi:hypothetical protein